MSLLAEIDQCLERAELAPLPARAREQMAEYLELLLRWNARVNLTGLRTAAEMIERHLVESVFLAEQLPEDCESLMDFGSGAGVPGLMVAMCRPGIRVTLAEAQGRKASFLREAVRSLQLGCEVYEGRVEAMPVVRSFHAVTMRAVEKMELAIPVAMRRAERYLALLTTESLSLEYREQFREIVWRQDVRLPHAEHRVFLLGVPRGTGALCPQIP